MRVLVAVCSLLAVLAGPARAQVTWTDEPIGRTSVVRLRAAPFPHPSRPQYRSDRVLVFVPAGHRPGPTLDVVVHYHGHRAEAVSSAKARLLREQLAASGRDAVLLCPQGPLRAADSAGGKHEEAGGLRRFLDEALALLVSEGVAPEGAAWGRVILSGHSGAYRVIARALDQGGVDVQEVWLHDAVYGQLPSFVRWATGGEGRRLVSTHTPHGGTRANNGELRRQLVALGVPVVTADDDAQHAGARAVIVAAPETHDQVTHLRRRFERFLRTSCLRPPASPEADDAAGGGGGIIDALPGQ